MKRRNFIKTTGAFAAVAGALPSLAFTKANKLIPGGLLLIML